MGEIIGNAIGNRSVWAGYCTYTLADSSSTEYTVTINDIGLAIIQDKYYYKNVANKKFTYKVAAIPGAKVNGEIMQDLTGEIATTTCKNIGNNRIWEVNTSIVIPKSLSEFTTHVDVEFSTESWTEIVRKTGKVKTGHDGDVSYMKIPITIPAKPAPTNLLSVERGSKQGDTWPMNMTLIIESWGGDQISLPTIYENETTTVSNINWKYNGQSVSFPITIPESPSNVITLTAQVNGYDEDPVLFTAVSRGAAGNSAPSSYLVSAGYCTVDLRAGGKGVSVGEKATEDKFNCNMPSLFKKGLQVGLSTGQGLGTDTFECNLNATFKHDLILMSSTAGSTKKFRIKVNDLGVVFGEEVAEPVTE